MKKELSTNGFTMTELVVTVALMGTLLSLVAPKFTNVSEETQGNGILQICILFARSFFITFTDQCRGKVMLLISLLSPLIQTN